MDYQKRLIKFLKANPKVKFTVDEIAAVWKRNSNDVWFSAMRLFDSGKLAFVGSNNTLKLKREGIGGA